jgi:hypothetical protein
MKYTGNKSALYVDESQYKRPSRKPWWILVIASLMFLYFMFFIDSKPAHSKGQMATPAEEVLYTEKLKNIVIEQTLPENYKDLPWITFVSAKGAYMAWENMPRPTYVVIVKSPFSLRKNKSDEKMITSYRIYFTPKPGTAYDIPKYKVVQYENGEHQ